MKKLVLLAILTLGGCNDCLQYSTDYGTVLSVEESVNGSWAWLRVKRDKDGSVCVLRSTMPWKLKEGDKVRGPL